RKNLTPDEVAYLADLIGDLVDSILENDGNSDFLDAVEIVLDGDTPEESESEKLNGLIDEFTDDYEESLELYHKLQEEHPTYRLKNPKTECVKALKEAR